ncbi:hypothetical protein [Pseudanabaena sp. lw0831]|uniref:hypothetical protein n=1 Tax=Pseudanabaena sp. lw0831 TaxID=1357935 RepID=UPI001915A39B|nr:hypothetical protein [Pseudanabaena sp. lw0831]
MMGHTYTWFLHKSLSQSAKQLAVASVNNCNLMQCDRLVLELLSKLNLQPYCLGTTKSGYPCRPLYVML